MKEIYIYELSCPITGIPKYVGKSVNPIKRLNQHIAKTKCKKGNLTLKESWIKNLLNKNLNPICIILDICYNDDTANILETYYISLYKSWGFKLKNGTNGGDGFSNMSEETKIKLRGKRPQFSGENNHFYGKSHTEETKKLMSKPRYDGFKEKCKIFSTELIKNNPHLGFQKGINNPSSKSVSCYDKNNNLIKIYDYIEEVKIDGFSASCVSKCIIGKNKTHKGFIFKLTIFQ